MRIIKPTGQEFQKLITRFCRQRKRVVSTVSTIIDDVRLTGDGAVLKYTKRFDKVRLSPRQFKVTEREISGAFQNISSEFVSGLKAVIDNVSVFYEK